jgi:hypothetical protein
VSSFFGELFEGFGYIRRSRLLLAITATAFAAEMLAFNYLTLVPVFAKDVFGGGAGLLGALNGTMPIGELLGASLMAAFAARVMRPGRLMVFSIIGTFAVGIPLGASGWLPASLVLREAPVEARARVLGTQQVSWGAGALGGLMSGALASATNPHLGIVIPACIGLVIVGIIIVVSPELRSGGRATVVDEQ